ncbi:hypothetical protein J6590_002856 [Homalodisca vitripennis]|nr:hypothetical protein J6590_002856 [Homalodisca vitripennis]
MSYSSGQAQNSLNMPGLSSSSQYIPSDTNMYPNIRKSFGTFHPSTSHQPVMQSQFGAIEHTSTSSSNHLFRTTTNVPSLTYRTDATITTSSDPASHV